MDLSPLKANADLHAFSPGRINLIGEHTDYNQGWVFPAAIQLGLTAHLRRRSDTFCRIHSSGMDDSFEVSLEALSRSEHSWRNYFLGVIHGICKRTDKLGGFEAFIDGDLPAGAGMSSSAALECCLAFGLNELYTLGLSRHQLLEITREADREYVGVASGPMDQYASLFGNQDHFLLLDCRSLEHSNIPAPSSAYRWVLLDSGVSHALADGEYNRRQAECEEGVAAIKVKDPMVRSLRDATIQHLEAVQDQLPAKVTQRCLYVIQENERVLKAADALKREAWEVLGGLLNETHEGLRDRYEVSCPEIDYLVSRARLHPKVLGARLMGGGFGGCTLNLVHTDAVDSLVEDCSRAYFELYGKTLVAHRVSPSDGARLL